MPRPKLTPEERKARLKARKQRNHAKNRERRLAMMRARHHATMATMTPEELQAHRAEARQRVARYADRHRAEINAKHRADYWTNPEKYRAKRRAYHLTHLDQETAAKKRWREANPDKAKEGLRKWRIANADRIKVYMAAWREANPDKQCYPATQRAYALLHAEENRARAKAWAKANPEKARERNQRHIARKHGAQRVTLSAAQWKEIKQAFNHCCAYCGRKMQRLEREHITPTVDSGDYHIHNIVPACRSCNATKGKGPPLTPVQPLLLTIAPERKSRKKVS